MTPSLSARICPACGGAVSRSRRRLVERELVPGHRRWRCKNAGCGWLGLLPNVTPAAPSPQRSRSSRKLARSTLAVAGGALAALALVFLMRSPAPPAAMVGPHVVLRGTHLEGEPLPAAHPLRSALPPPASDAEPRAYAEDASSLLRLRRHCAWGLPGRNPYRGSAVQALQTATLSATVVKQIAADIQAGKRVDRVTIDNDGIRARRSGREFDPQRVAMTYGMTMCVDTRVNFSPGHSEQGDLYEAMDDDGRIYAVMVPDACGNVSVLGQRYAKGPAPPDSAANVAAEDPRPWMRVPPEDRIRELPRALRFADSDDHSDGTGRRTGTAVSAPGTLALSALALALAWLVGRTRRRAR